MKNLFYLLLLVLPLGFTACGDDDPDGGSDTTNPTVSITSPADGTTVAQGETFTAIVDASDDRELTDVIISIGDWFDETYAANSTAGNFTADIEVPADQASGDYDLTATATDAAGNTATATVTVTVSESVVPCEATEACKVDGQVTFLVKTPANTPADAIVHVAGSFQAWNSTTTPLTKVDGADNCFCGSFALAGGEEFKFTRGGADFADVEKSADCEEIDNRIYNVGDGTDDVVVYEVAEWRDICE